MVVQNDVPQAWADIGAIEPPQHWIGGPNGPAHQGYSGRESRLERMTGDAAMRGRVMSQHSLENVRLDDEKRDRLKRCLRKSGDGVSNSGFEKFDHDVTRAMEIFLEDTANNAMTGREVHNAIREIWKLANEPDPPVGQIRARIKALPEQVIRKFDYLGRQEIPKFYGPGISPGLVGGDQTAMPRIEEEALRNGGFRSWAAVANDQSLIWAVLTLPPVTGLVIVQGRSRRTGKRSSPGVEPYINRIARGAGDGMPRVGRPSSLDFKISLIGKLAHAWERTTGTFPPVGRSDETGFGELIHCVFHWLRIGDQAEYALRQFWDEVPTS